MKNRIALLTAAMTVLTITSACEKKATGQIAAVVNGEEVSQAELNAELEGVRLPEGADKKQVMREILQRVIDRKLLVQSAREQGLDKSPEYLTQQRRLNENLLVSLIGKQAASTVRIPAPAEIDRYINENPTLFAGRTRYQLDQLQFDAPADRAQLQPLAQAHSLEAVARVLDQQGIRYERGRGVLDSASVPPAVMKQIQALPAGEPFVTPAGGKFVASVITGSETVPTSPETARPAATELLRRQTLMETTRKQVAQARAGAKIDYQPGFEPAKTPAGAAPATKKI